MRRCLPAFYGPGPSVQTLIGVGGLIGRLFCRHIERLGQVLPRGFQVSGIFNIYSKASSYMDIRRKFATYSGFKFLTYSLHIQYMLVLLLSICNEYVANMSET